MAKQKREMEQGIREQKNSLKNIHVMHGLFFNKVENFFKMALIREHTRQHLWIVLCPNLYVCDSAVPTKCNIYIGCTVTDLPLF